VTTNPNHLEELHPLVTVHKLDLTGREVIAYQGRLIERNVRRVVVDARWRHAARDYGYARFEPGDHFIEYYYCDRWYTVFEIRAAASEVLKGWYCNITYPARVENHEIRSVDLALDLWVYPDRQTLILDEAEFAALPLDPAQRQAAISALAELQALAAAGALPPA